MKRITTITVNPDHPARRSIRLQSYNYADEGAYFVTICTNGRVCAFGEVVGGEMRLSRVGKIVAKCWYAIPDHFPGVELDAFIVMPNHLHGIIVIAERSRHNVGARHAVPLQSPLQKFGKPVPGSLSTIVRSFKSAATRNVNLLLDTPAAPLWQRNYYEHVIRDEADLNRIREYINCNPQMWNTDEENPARFYGT